MANTKEIIRRVSEELYGEGRLELVDELFAEDYVNHDPPQGFGRGRDDVREFIRTIHAGLSDVKSTATNILVDGNEGAVRWTVTAVHSGELFGIPPTNRQLNHSGICIYRIENGRVVEEWQQRDDLGLLQQLGAIPEMA